LERRRPAGPDHGTFTGAVKIAYNVGTGKTPIFDAPVTAIDADGQTLEGSYNLNVRIADLNQDSVPDFVDSYNWGTIQFRINAGSGAARGCRGAARLVSRGRSLPTWTCTP